MTCELTHFAIGKHDEYHVHDPEIKLPALGVFNVMGGGSAHRLLGMYPVRVALRWDQSSSPEVVDISAYWDGTGCDPAKMPEPKRPPQILDGMGSAVVRAIERSLAQYPEGFMPVVFDFGLRAGDQVPTEAELKQVWAVITGGVLYDQVFHEFSSCLAWFVGRRLGRMMPPKMLQMSPR